MAIPVWPERLPCRVYTVANGLPHNRTTAILEDSRGLAWIGTIEGLARLDGSRFRTYDARDGLQHPVIAFVAETRDGTLWAGTGRGLFRWRLRRQARRHPGLAQFPAGEAEFAGPKPDQRTLS